MKLAFCVRAVYPQHGAGGLERAAAAQVRHLLALGADVALYTQPLPQGLPFAHHGSSESVGRLEVRGVKYGALPLRPNGIAARLTNYPAFVTDMGGQVGSAARNARLDGVYAHGLCAWGVRRAGRWGIPVVANPHGLEEFKVRDPAKRLAYAPFRRWVRQGCRAADRVIATDSAMKEEVARLLGLPERRVVVIPSGVDIEEADAAVSAQALAHLRRRLPALQPASGAVVGLSVGRLEENKGFGDLIEALGKCARTDVVPWVWVFVGDGTLRGNLEARAAREGIADRVLFAGGVTDDELHALYRRADLFAHPARYEGSSLVTLEAMAHGLPVIATRVGGIPDKVEEGENGYLVEPGRPGELARATGRVLRNSEAGRRMGARGRQIAAEKFSWRRSMRGLLELFAQLQEAKASCGTAGAAVGTRT